MGLENCCRSGNEQKEQNTYKLMHIASTDLPIVRSVPLETLCSLQEATITCLESIEPPSNITRSSSNLPSSSKHSILGEQCLFCGRKRKRKSQSNEALHQYITNDGSKAILLAASRKSDARFFGLGKDLIAIEAKYHNTCWHDYIRQEEKDEQQTSNRNNTMKPSKHCQCSLKMKLSTTKKHFHTCNSTFQLVQRRVSCCWRNTG